MDFTDIEGITGDDLNAENKDLRRSIYIEFSKSTSKGTLLLGLTKKFEQFFSENLLPFKFKSDILRNFFKEDKIPSELKSAPEDDKSKFVPLHSNTLHNNFSKRDKVPSKWDSSSEDDDLEYVCPGERSTFRPRSNLRIANLFKRKRPPKKKKHWLNDIVYPKKRQRDNLMYYSPSSSYSESEERAAKEKLKSEIMELINSVRKAKFQSTSKQPEDKEDVEVACSSPPSSVFLPSPSSSTVADQLERKRTSDSDLEGGDTARVVSQDSSDISDSFFEVRKMSSTSVPVDTEDVCSSQGRKKRYQHKLFQTRKVPNTLEASSTNTSGSDLSDNTREAQERERWDRGHRKPCYAHVKVLIFLKNTVCHKLAKYLGLIYIEDILTEARKNRSKRFRISQMDGLKYCPFIQPYINKKRTLGRHDICLTNCTYLWHTIYADYKAVINSGGESPRPYREVRKDTNIYVELGNYPHFLEYVEAVTLIINEKLGESFHTIARYRCKDQRDNADNLKICDWANDESSDDLVDDSSSDDS